MADVEALVKTTLSEIERILSTKTVVGEPIVIEGNTIIPLISIGFGFGGGGGSGGRDKDEGSGAGTGGGGGVKPIGVIVVNSEGVRVEAVKGKMGGMMEAATEGITRIMDKRSEQKKKAKQEDA